MALEADIQIFSEQHLRELNDSIGAVALNYQRIYKKKFPSNALAAGNNWFYIASAEPLSEHYVHLKEGSTMVYPCAIKVAPKKPCITSGFMPLENILEYSKNFFQGEEIALIPVGEARNEDAKKLGKYGQVWEDWYDVVHNGKTIRVFYNTENSRGIDLGKTAEGVHVTYALPIKKPITH